MAAASATADEELTLGSRSTGPEVVLDWFREDPLANEHHEHWHWVYPNQPPPPKPVKERHGELFYYMHQQMLARYDAERIAAGLEPVVPLEDFVADLGEGYDPGLLVTNLDYELRDAGETMVDQPDYSRAELTELTRRLKEAASRLQLGPDTDFIALRGHEGSDLLGHEAEPTTASRFPDIYGWHHGMGHMLISAASDRDLGVMSDPAAAIRDPVFWRWHRHVDDLHFAYQDRLEPHAFDDQPPVEIKQLWVELEGVNGQAPPEEEVIELRTAMRSGGYTLLNGQRYRFDYLSHEPFQVRVAVENASEQPVPATFRLFLLPHALFDPMADPGGDAGRGMRRFAIELDKVKVDAAPGALTFTRAGRDMSVIRRPAVIDPAEVADVDGGISDEASQECTCGWPFGLLVPRGTAEGMPFSLFAMLTDNRLDRVGSAKACGSMSFCGVGDRYPDARPMGYPFDRRLERSVAEIVQDTPTMALRPVTIRWTNPPQG